MVDLAQEIREEWAGFIHDEHTYSEIDKYHLAMKAADALEEWQKKYEDLESYEFHKIMDLLKWLDISDHEEVYWEFMRSWVAPSQRG